MSWPTFCLLAVVTSLLFIVCRAWGVVHVWRGTAHRGRLAKVLWRFVVGGPRRRFPGLCPLTLEERAADGLGWPWRPLGAHIALAAVAVAGLALSTIAVAAAWIPARRATRLPPTVALRAD